MNRLLISDLKRFWRQALAISLLLGCSIALFVMSNSSMLSLERTREQYYRDYRFGEVFTRLARGPESLAGKISTIPGVQEVQTRIIRDVLLDIPDMIEPASCRLVSIMSDAVSPMNGIHLLRGRFPDADKHTEVIVNEAFAVANQFGLGDSFVSIMGGKKQRLRIVGIGISPEYVYLVQPGMMITDDRRFGVVWMPRKQMAAAFNMEGAFNALSLDLRPRVSVKEVIHQVDRLTHDYGGTGAYGRDDQLSHRRLVDEMHQMKRMAFLTPSIFLIVSIFLFNIVFTRLIDQNTEQIATLRAFGYRPLEIGWHYIKMVLFLVFIATLMGWTTGLGLSWWMTQAYTIFFRFPDIQHHFATFHAVGAVGIGVGAAIVGTGTAIGKAVRLQPAEAMRLQPPKDYRGLIGERTGLSQLLSPVGRMVVRRLETNRMATTLSIFGMSLAIAVLVLGAYMRNMIDYLIDFQFERSQRHDVMLTFVETMSEDAIHDAKHLPGVYFVEPYRAAPVRLRNAHRSRLVSLMGLEQRPELYRIVTDQLQPLEFPPFGGLTISEKMAELLDVRPGDEVWVDILDRRQRSCRIPIARVFSSFTDPTAFLNRQQLHAILGEGNQYSGLFLSIDTDTIDDLYREVKQMPTVAGVVDKNTVKENFCEMVEDASSLMRSVNAVFSCLIAMGVIYNCATIMFAEHVRDLATLRVMGFRRLEVSRILLSELAVITVMAIPLGLAIGFELAYMTTLALDTETHRFPFVIERSTFAYAIAVIMAFASLSALYVRRLMNALDLVAVLKVKE